MQPLKGLAHLEQQASQLNRQRHELGEEFRQTGLAELANAWRAGFQNKDQLSKSFSQLIRALQHNRKDAEAYLGLAYLQLLIGAQPMALRYLQEGLRVVPSHPGLQALLAELARPTLPATPVGNESDALEALIRGRIETAIGQINALQATTWPCLEREVLIKQELRYQQQRTELAELDKALAALEAQCETPALYLRFRKIETLLGQWRQRLDVSKQSGELKQSLQLCEREISATFAQLVAYTPDQREAWLESLFDRCDQFADQLDALEERGYSIEALVQIYKRLCLCVESSTERVDELFG